MKDDKYVLEHKELVEMLLKKHGIHEGIWGVHVEFKFMGANIGPPGEILPANITAVSRVGIQTFPEESNIAFDAAKLNPPRIFKKETTRRRIDRNALTRK